MKKLLCAVIFLCAAGASIGSNVWSEIEIDKQVFCTVEQGEQLKGLVPKYGDWINSYILALKQGMTASYEVGIWLDQDDDPIRSAYVVKPNAVIVPLVKDGPDSFHSGNNGPSEFYTSIADLESHWPHGVYQLVVTFVDGHTQTWNTTIPDYDTTPFPNIVSGSLSTDVQGQLLLDWSTVDGVGEYEVWVFEIKKQRDVYDSDNLYLTPPQSLKTPLIGAYAGKGDYNIGVQAENDVTSGQFGVEFNTQGNWFSFKNQPAAIQNKIDKCTVAAGTKIYSDSISFSGILNAIEADFVLANGKEVCVTIDSNLMPDPKKFYFPINSTTFKKGKYNCKFTEKGAAIAFSFDSKTHKMAFSAKNIDLTGFACPASLKITISDYEAELQLDETVVNGIKSCPFQLMMGAANTITVSNKSKVKYGKKAVGTDSITVLGTFTTAGDPNMNKPFVVNIGTQTFTVGGFTEKGDLISCSKAKCVENLNWLCTAKLDFAKCTYTITLSNITIDKNGVVTFGVNVFGFDLGGPGSDAKVNTGF